MEYRSLYVFALQGREMHVGENPAVARAGGPARVLVVDDNPDILLSTSALLEVMGHEARVASTGQDCLREIPSFGPDLVLLDIAMPVMSGMEVAHRIRDLHLAKEPALAAMTGFTTQEIQTECAEAGFDHYLVKPVDVAALDQVIWFSRPDSSPHEQFLDLQSQHREAVYAFTRSQLDFCEMMLDLATRSRRAENRERQLQKVARSLDIVGGWLEKQSDMPRRQWHAIRSQAAVLKYRLASMKEQA